MAFNDTILSTLASISAWEQEVNQLAGYVQKHGLTATSDMPVSIEFSEAIESCVVTYENAESAALIIASDKVTVDLVAGKNVISIAVTGDKSDTFNLNEGYGTTIYGAEGKLTGAISSGDAWTIANAQRTWQDKIDLAHRQVENDVLTALYNRLFQYSDEQIIASISNPQTLADAVDLKALALIYSDLSNGGFNQLHETKARDYYRKYQAELNNALRRLKIDLAEGSGGERIVTQGILSR